jgi:hypothetical protein
MWAGVGFVIAVFWALYAFPTMTSADRLLPLIQLTCPITLLRSYPLSLPWVLAANAATYALIGLAVESVRRQLRPAQ